MTVRQVRFGDLSFFHNATVTAEEALQAPERARRIRYRGDWPGEAIAKLRRVMHLELSFTSHVPEQVRELRHLRTLGVGSGITEVPAFVFDLPHLESLYCHNSNVHTLHGLKQGPRLRSITLSSSPLGDDTAALDALIAKTPGAMRMRGMDGIELLRPEPGKPKQTGKALVTALQNDEIADGADLRGADLHGAVFDDLLVTHNFRDANLANTTWRRCDIKCDMSGADLSGAVFEECYFGYFGYEPGFANVTAPAITFRRSYVDLKCHGADLTGAVFEDLVTSPSLDLTNAKAPKMQLRFRVNNEREINVKAPGADLRGATIEADIVPGRRQDLMTTKKNARVSWAQIDTTGAKIDDTTTITYVPLRPETEKPAKASKGAKQKSSAKSSAKTRGTTTGDEPPAVIDKKGPHADVIGKLSGLSAAMWFLAIDAQDAAAWTGGGEDGASGDFQRALEVEDRDGKKTIKVGKATGVIASLEDVGWSHVFRHGKDLLLLQHYRRGNDQKGRAMVQAAAARVAQLPADGKPTKLGAIEVKSGVLALLLPYEVGTFAATVIAKAKQSKEAVSCGGGRVLVAVPKGTYNVIHERLGPDGYEDDFGTYPARVRISPA